MATVKRADFPGAIHHVYPRGNNRHTIFHSDADRVYFLELLGKLKVETGFSLQAYCQNAYFVRLIRYIHMNPVAAGIVARPEDWPWSGHNELATGICRRLDHELPLAYFGGDPPLARIAYREFMRQPDPEAEADFSHAPRTAGITELSVRRWRRATARSRWRGSWAARMRLYLSC